MSDEIGDSMAEMGRGVEAAVRIPPYDVVVKRLHRRRRRRVGVGGLVLAALAAVGVTVLPQATRHPVRTMQTAAVRVAPQSGPGTLTLDDVSFLGPSGGLVLGRRCADGCQDVTLSTTDGGDHYGPEVAVPGRHRYVAAGRDIDVAYAPDLAVRASGSPTWTPLDVPAPVADIAVSDGSMTVLLVPPGAPAEIWTGPATPTSWSQFRRYTVVTGSDASARLVVGGTAPVVVSTSGTPRIATVAPAAAGAVPVVAEAPLAVCGSGSRPSVSATTATTWWVACRGQRTGGSSEEVAVTTDGGRSFSNVDAVPSGSLDLSVLGVSPTTAYLYGGPDLLVTHDGGTTWQTSLSEAGLGAPHVPAGADGRDVWVVAPGRTTIYRTFGGSWTGLRLR
ncbi:MAG: WD40/YVTN/BNR-like repeat-containing protein [Mycobacteriales bacterium]